MERSEHVGRTAGVGWGVAVGCPSAPPGLRLYFFDTLIFLRSCGEVQLTANCAFVSEDLLRPGKIHNAFGGEGGGKRGITPPLCRGPGVSAAPPCPVSGRIGGFVPVLALCEGRALTAMNHPLGSSFASIKPHLRAPLFAVWNAGPGPALLPAAPLGQPGFSFPVL